jgi:predicted nucleotide-binding protein (sugar kinase/HSP70/actin superfamily)
MNPPGDAYDKGVACPHTQTIPYVSRVAFQGSRTVSPVINFRRGRKYLVSELMKSFRPYGIRKTDLVHALKSAQAAQDSFAGAIKSRGAEVLAGLKEKAVVIVGRAYNALDGGVNLGIPQKLSELGVLSIPFDFLPLEDYHIEKDWPNMYWRSGQRILKTIRLIREKKDLYPLFIGNFLCGPDSFILKYVRQDLGDKPFLHIEVDEHSADAGAITRCEAFLDSLPEKSRPAPTWKQHPVPHAVPLKGTGSKRTIYIPRMADHAFALAAAFQHSGLDAEVLPESDRETADLGKKYVSGKECYPCTVTTGDMLKKVMSSGFVPGKSAFFMPSGTGPCRFGQYNIFHRMVLAKLGFQDVPIFSPTQDTTFYRDLGIVGKKFTMHAWKGIVAFELLNKSLHETRPYERHRGSADQLYTAYREKLYRSLQGNGNDRNLQHLLAGIRRDFHSLPTHSREKPLIGVIGEIFVRSHKFSNEHLVRKVEELQGEVWLAPVEEWIYYVNLIGLRKALLKREKSAIINFLLKRHFQKKVEHKYARHFHGFLKTLHEPGTKEILEKAAPYVHSSFEGETVLSIGKCIDLIERGASGIINAMPFGCMPGTIVTAIMRGVSRDYGVPCISIPYDGTESPTLDIQLEAFMDQARAYKRERAGSR